VKPSSIDRLIHEGFGVRITKEGKIRIAMHCERVTWYTRFRDWLLNRGRWSHKTYSCYKCGGAVEQRGNAYCYSCIWK
jgi:hypothetical protein